MKVKNIVLGGVAAIALAGGFAAPSLAQYAGNPPQYSTPEEKAQTQQLNQQAQDGTTASPAALNGQGGDPNAPSPQNQAAQAQYQAQQAQYQDDMARYRAQHRQYMRDIHRYDEARYYFTDYPHAYPYRYDNAELHPLYLLAEPSQQLADVPVEGRDGVWVGRVRNVEMGLDNHPRRVEIALNHRVSVWVSPGDLRFDPAHGILFTDLSRADLWNMPGAAFSS
ncbi:MAG TPA: hypothetical protein VG867_09255 [Rhizomicrobium sp.]|nr:hypothetical protein [Rhizomicrobium sp.]